MTVARRLTQDGINRAREWLRVVRTEPTHPLDVPADLLNEGPWSSSMVGAPEVKHQNLRTRRDAADYLVLLQPRLNEQFVDDWGFWSWMGMFHFADIVPDASRRARLSPETETFVVALQSEGLRRPEYRNYLWTSWRLMETFGREVPYLLDRDVMDLDRISRQIVNSPRIFNSVGVAGLILLLYTDEGTAKQGHTSGPGCLEHLLGVLPQLERTYDVYGMTTEALLDILPKDFDVWKPATSST